jgi:hypothetical protein
MLAVIDVEGNGLTPTKLHCMSTWTKEQGLVTYTDYNDMRDFLSKVTIFVGHNIRRWDVPVLERLLGIKLKCLIADTLSLAWYLEPGRGKYGLASYGVQFGVPKPPIDDWEELSVEEYIHRCEEDVKINTHLWNFQWKYLKELYRDEDQIWSFVGYLSFKMYCAHLQEVSRWKLDIEYATKALKELEEEEQEKIKILTDLMPKIPKYAIRKAPAKFTKKDGSLTSKAQEWFDLLFELNLPADTLETKIIIGYDEPNPSSSQQIKDYLFTLGWVPRTFEYKDKKEIPQVNQKHGKGICNSVKELYEKEPKLEVLEGLSVISHRISILKGFLSSQKNGYVKASIQGLTNTLRFRHAHPCVNLPKPDRPYAQSIRTSLVAEQGYELCGADMSSLEDRLKQHFIYPLDPDYVKTMLEPGYDPHLKVAVTAKMMTEEDAQAYKNGDKSKSRIRDMAKNGGYAMQYGAFPPKLVKTLNITLEKAKELFDGYWELNWAIKEVAKRQKIKTIGDQMWLLNPVSGFWYSLRFEKDIFSTLIQGTASFVFDLWVKKVLETRPQLTAQFHDEIVLCIKQGFREQATKLLENAISKTNEILKLNRELAIGIQFGTTYAEIH